MQFVNNYHVLHARDAYTDDRPNGQVRHLKRLWLETRVLTDDDKPDAFRLGATTDTWWEAARREAAETGLTGSPMDAAARAAHLLALHRPGRAAARPEPVGRRLGQAPRVARLRGALHHEQRSRRDPGRPRRVDGPRGGDRQRRRHRGRGGRARERRPRERVRRRPRGRPPRRSARRWPPGCPAARSRTTRCARRPDLPDRAGGGAGRGGRRGGARRRRCTSCSPPAPRTTSAAATTWPTRSPGSRRSRRPAPTCSTRPGSWTSARSPRWCRRSTGR